jgi:hypothetical protein
MYRKHTQYPGGLKETKYKDMLEKKPDEVRDLLSLSHYLLRDAELSGHTQGSVGHVTKE